jgi:hypothetical protein
MIHGKAVKVGNDQRFKMGGKPFFWGGWGVVLVDTSQIGKWDVVNVLVRRIKTPLFRVKTGFEKLPLPTDLFNLDDLRSYMT